MIPRDFITEWEPEIAFARVQHELVQRLPGEPWKGTADGN